MMNARRTFLVTLTSSARVLAMLILASCAAGFVNAQTSETSGATERAQTLTGTVKWFSDAKGYGFIVPDGGGEDVYVHHSKIMMDEFRSLTKGQRVRFILTEGRRGKEASEVEVVQEAPAPSRAPSK